jgi:hypothetical protein
MLFHGHLCGICPLTSSLSACAALLQLLLHGRASRASDVYAYGILLWDLATGQRAFAGEAGTAHSALCSFSV